MSQPRRPRPMSTCSICHVEFPRPPQKQPKTCGAKECLRQSQAMGYAKLKAWEIATGRYRYPKRHPCAHCGALYIRTQRPGKTSPNAGVLCERCRLEKRQRRKAETALKILVARSRFQASLWRDCSVCGRRFKASHSSVKRMNICGYQCRRVANKLRKRIRDRKQFPHRLLLYKPRRCVSCGVTFTPAPPKAQGVPATKFCDRCSHSSNGAWSKRYSQYFTGITSEEADEAGLIDAVLALRELRRLQDRINQHGRSEIDDTTLDKRNAEHPDGAD